MGFEWDEESKAGINYRKHGIRMPEAVPVLTILTPSRFRMMNPIGTSSDSSALGMGAMGRLLVVVYTWRGENIRIISARRAEAHERKQYEAER